MKYKNLLLALIASLPLAPLLLSDTVNLDNVLDKGNYYWLMPFILEIFCFYAVYLQAKGESKITPREQKLYVIFAVCLFAVIGGFMTTIALLSDDLSLRPEYWLLMIYVLINLILTTKRIVKTPQLVMRFFTSRYVYPYLLAAFIYIITTTLGIRELNIFALFLIIRNFTSAKYVT